MQPADAFGHDIRMSLISRAIDLSENISANVNGLLHVGHLLFGFLQNIEIFVHLSLPPNSISRTSSSCKFTIDYLLEPLLDTLGTESMSTIRLKWLTQPTQTDGTFKLRLDDICIGLHQTKHIKQKSK